MSTIELPALPKNEKTYAGIPEAVFVVSSNNNESFQINLKNVIKLKLKISPFSLFRFGNISVGRC